MNAHSIPEGHDQIQQDQRDIKGNMTGKGLVSAARGLLVSNVFSKDPWEGGSRSKCRNWSTDSKMAGGGDSTRGEGPEWTMTWGGQEGPSKN